MTRLNRCRAQCHEVTLELCRLGCWDDDDMYADEGGCGGGPKVCCKNCADILRGRIDPVIGMVIHHLPASLLVIGLLIPTRFVRYHRLLSHVAPALPISTTMPLLPKLYRKTIRTSKQQLLKDGELQRQ